MDRVRGGGGKRRGKRVVGGRESNWREGVGQGRREGEFGVGVGGERKGEEGGRWMRGQREKRRERKERVEVRLREGNA